MKNFCWSIGLLALCASTPALAQSWNPISQPSLQSQGLLASLSPTTYHLVEADTLALLSILHTAPLELINSQVPPTAHQLLLPYPDGSIHAFRIVNSPVMEEALQAKYPEIITVKGYGIDNPHDVMRLSWNPYTGLRALVLSLQGDVVIEPYATGEKRFYFSCYRQDEALNTPFHCLTPNENHTIQENHNGLLNQVPPARCYTSLLHYRLAMTCTGEAARLMTKSSTPSVPQVLAEIISLVNGVSLIYEKELSIRFLLVADNDKIIFTDPTTDPFLDSDDISLDISQGGKTIDSLIGLPNFDVGHTLSHNVGGIASRASVCTSIKAEGASGLKPFGDIRPGIPFIYHLLTHELGHQFGATHSFNGGLGCWKNVDPVGAYEPTSGTTIMSYANPCGLIQRSSDLYFHANSRIQIIRKLFDSITCVYRGDFTGNNPPVITSRGYLGSGVIPAQTPFVLSGSATDPDHDPITYCWEEMDLGSGDGDPQAPPFFRSRMPKPDGKRTFPDMRVILANYPTTAPPDVDGLRGEELPPKKSRQLFFSLTVRDNKGGVTTAGGREKGVCSSEEDLLSIAVDSSAGPFLVATPSTGTESWTAITSQQVTWDVANTGPGTAVNCEWVKISLSVDGGLTYPFVLQRATLNTGTAWVTVPFFSTSQKRCRIRVEAVDNIFFDISNNDFTIEPLDTPGSLFANSHRVESSRLPGLTNEQNTTPFLIVPNPVSEHLELIGIDANPASPVVVELIDLMGRVVLRHTWQKRPIPVASLPAGIYTARISLNGILSQTKILKITP